jgi:uncharacterized protein
MILRLLLLGLLAWLAYKLIRRYLASSAPSQAEPTHGDMVQCAHCGVHIPKQEAIGYQNKFYCCQDHFNTDKN